MSKKLKEIKQTDRYSKCQWCDEVGNFSRPRYHCDVICRFGISPESCGCILSGAEKGEPGFPSVQPTALDLHSSFWKTFRDPPQPSRLPRRGWNCMGNLVTKMRKTSIFKGSLCCFSWFIPFCGQHLLKERKLLWGKAILLKSEAGIKSFTLGHPYIQISKWICRKEIPLLDLQKWVSALLNALRISSKAPPLNNYTHIIDLKVKNKVFLPRKSIQQQGSVLFFRKTACFSNGHISLFNFTMSCFILL